MKPLMATIRPNKNIMYPVSTSDIPIFEFKMFRESIIQKRSVNLNPTVEVIVLQIRRIWRLQSNENDIKQSQAQLAAVHRLSSELLMLFLGVLILNIALQFPQDLILLRISHFFVDILR